MSPSTPTPMRRAVVWRALSVGAAFLAGLLLATTIQTARDTELRPAQPLAGLVASRDQQVKEKAARVAQLETDVERLTDEQARTNEQVRQATEQGDVIAPAAGAEAVEGPGLVVVLNDSSKDARHPPAGFTASDMVVHQQDVQAVVNALWRGGAEGLTIQGQRVVSTSAVRCVGNTLILEGRVYAPPYTIAAIGDRDAMQKALDTDHTVTVYRQYVEAVALGYDVQHQDHITMPAFEGSVKPCRAMTVG